MYILVMGVSHLLALLSNNSGPHTCRIRQRPFRLIHFIVEPGDRLDSIDVDQGHDSTLAYRRLEIGFRLPWI